VRTDAKRFIDSRLEPGARAPAQPAAASAGARTASPSGVARGAMAEAFWVQWYASAAEYLANLVNRAGIEGARGKAIGALAVLLAIAGLATHRAGVLAGLAALVCGGAMFGVWLASRIQRRR
jgi:tight adherence protein B